MSTLPATNPDKPVITQAEFAQEGMVAFAEGATNAARRGGPAAAMLALWSAAKTLKIGSWEFGPVCNLHAMALAVECPWFDSGENPPNELAVARAAYCLARPREVLKLDAEARGGEILGLVLDMVAEIGGEKESTPEQMLAVQKHVMTQFLALHGVTEAGLRVKVEAAAEAAANPTRPAAQPAPPVEPALTSTAPAEAPSPDGASS